MDTRHTTPEYIKTIKDVINVGSVCSIGWNPQHNPFDGTMGINTMLMPPRDIDRIAVESYMILQQWRIYGGPLGHAPFDKKYFFHLRKK